MLVSDSDLSLYNSQGNAKTAPGKGPKSSFVFSKIGLKWNSGIKETVGFATILSKVDKNCSVFMFINV